jgi:type III restriction enzyme
MREVVVEDPVINSPFAEPARHFRFDDEGITSETVPGRRVSSYFMPIPKAKKQGKGGKQLVFDSEWTGDRIEENKFINQIRERVGLWRKGGYVNVTRTTRRLLDHWTDSERDRRLFFCQIEALETAIYITEVAGRYGDAWIENQLRDFSRAHNPDLFRIAFKIATGGGKTAVMAMLVAWHALNKFANPQDARFADTFLVVSPGITIRDRLRVLLPTDPDNAYRKLDIVPSDLMDDLKRAKVLITNYHAFLLREKTEASKLTKTLSGQEKSGVNKESPEQMVRRVCREFGSKKNIVVLNDEAHHCYRRRLDEQEDKPTGEERREAEKRNEEARIWISGLEAIKRKIGVRCVYDLSATPFFLRGSGYREGTLFPWVASDFSLIDAIESGVVKVPRVPVRDTSMTGDQPTFRDLWSRIRDDLPKKGRGTEAVTGEPKLPAELQGAIESLYGHYKVAYAAWEQDTRAQERGQTPPVFIVVCNNTNVSNLVFKHVAGWEKELSNGETVLVPGQLPIFNNERGGRWSARPNTILVDSEQLESGEAMSEDFKRIAFAEIEEFKAELRMRFPGRNPDDITDEDLLREVMNTVGKPGKLGENIKCVVSVSMLTEGWDANTVTHILGVRAFGTQLLCEQVVGRGLRRLSYAPLMKTLQVNGEAVEIETFATEYAEVFGVPFSFIPTARTDGTPPQPKDVTRVRALEDRIDSEIRYPRVTGYRFILPTRKLTATFTDASRLAISPEQVPDKTENAPIVGESTIMDLDDLKHRREQEVAFLLAKLVLEKYFRQDGENRAEKSERHTFDADVQAWLFPQILDISKRWLRDCVTCKGDTFKQMLLLIEFAHDAADRIYGAIVESSVGEKTLVPILRPYEAEGSSRFVDFDTTRATYKTDAAKCHISHVVADTESWEQKMAQVLEDMDEVIHYTKNHNVGFFIPYTLNGEQRNYIPDFIAHIDDGHEDYLNLIIEVSGEAKKDKAAKVATARTFWVPAVNNHGGFGRWAFVEISDPWDAETTIRGELARLSA